MNVDIIIDSLTNCLIYRRTCEECDTEYCIVSRTISKDPQNLMHRDGDLIGILCI